MDLIIPTDEQFESMKANIPRRDWSPVYSALAEHGKVVLPKAPKNIRSVMSNHYIRSKNRARVVFQEDGSCLIYLESRNGQGA